MAQPPTLPEQAELPVARLLVDEGDNVRTVDEESAAFQELVRDVTARGILEPIIVRPYKNLPGDPQRGNASGWTHVLVSGFRRVAAAKAAKLAVVPVRVLDLTRAEAKEVQLIENLQRANLTPMEEARGVHQLFEVTGDKPKEIARKLSHSEAWVKDRHALLNLIPAFQDLLNAGRVPVAGALHLARSSVDVQVSIARVVGDTAWRIEELGDVDRVRVWVESETERIEERKKFLDEVAKEKFPTCPKKGCGKPAYTSADFIGDRIAQCPDHHTWDPATGKVVKKAERLTSYTPRAKAREREEVDRTESPIVRTWRTPTEILTEILAEHGADIVHFERMRVRGKEDPGGVSAVLRLPVVPKELLDALGKFGSHDGAITLHAANYSDGHFGYVVVHGAESKRREEQKKKLAPFVKALGGDRDAHSDVATPDIPDIDTTKLLDGSVDDVVGRLKKLDADALEVVRSAEVDGKCRGGVLDAVDRRLGHGAHTVHYRT
jgi:ParB/RepB/Spo0J family partition protein